MITYKLTGVDEVLSELGEWTNFLSAPEVNKIVLKATEPLIEEIKSEYRAAGLVKQGDLINSIDAFQRRRKGLSDPYFTYYVGPQWGSKLFKGGNHAALLEYGTVERFRANVSKGGTGRAFKGQRTGLSRVYGDKISTGKVKPYGVLRRSLDAVSRPIGEQMKKDIYALIIATAKKNGFK